MEQNHNPGSSKNLKSNGRYALRHELVDGTLEEPYHYMSRKDWALTAARTAAADCVSPDIVRVWVDDTKTDLGVKSFDVKR
jgi:hypothetical protein